MKKDEIKVGGAYLAKVGGVTVKVKVNRIRETHGGSTAYDVANTVTGAKTTFYSAAKFRSEVPELLSQGRHEEAVEKLREDPLGKIISSIKSAEPEQSKEICDVCGGYTARLQPGGCRCEELVKDDQANRTPDSELDTTEIEDQEDEQRLPPMEQPSTPALSVDTIGVMAPVQISDQTKEGEQSPLPTTDVQSVMETPSATTSALTTAPASSMLASRIARANQVRQQGTPVAGMVPNEEQASILAIAVERGLKVLVVGAGAGTGKTATLKMLEQTIPGRGQYTAFNTSLVNESREKFTKCAVNTTHSLAFRAVGKLYAHRLPGKNGAGTRIRSEQIARFLGIEPFTIILKGQGAPDPETGNPTDRVKVLQSAFLAGQVMVATQRFCQSADREISRKHFKYLDGVDAPSRHENNDLVKEYLIRYAQKAWTDLSSINGQLPFSHDVYVKLWQLGEGDERPIIASDYILLDEAQDTAPVFLDILKQQVHALLVFVGDSNQAIYEWRGAVDAMKAYPDAPRKLLSQSYRFGQAIADVANTILAKLEEPTDLVMRGLSSLPSRVAPVAEPRCYLYRTNAGAIGQVMQAVSEGKKPFLLGNIKEAVEFCKAALDLQNKRPTSHPDLGCFLDWGEVEEYTKTDEGADLKLMVKLVNEFGAQEIINALKDMPKEENADLVVSTAHKSKGREWNTVKLGADFPLANKMTDADRRLLYVAATRAKLTLDISECPPFCGGNDTFDAGNPEKSGAWVPGLTIRYTKPMPTEEEQLEWLKSKQAPVEKSPTSRSPASETLVGGLPVQPTSSAPNAIVSDSGVRPAVIVNGPFTWTKFNDKWLIRGQPNVQIGARVKVTRKDGSSAEVVIKEVVKRFNDAWIYGT